MLEGTSRVEFETLTSAEFEALLQIRGKFSGEFNWQERRFKVCSSSKASSRAGLETPMCIAPGSTQVEGHVGSVHKHSSFEMTSCSSGAFASHSNSDIHTSCQLTDWWFTAASCDCCAAQCLQGCFTKKKPKICFASHLKGHFNPVGTLDAQGHVKSRLQESHRSGECGCVSSAPSKQRFLSQPKHWPCGPHLMDFLK